MPAVPGPRGEAPPTPRLHREEYLQDYSKRALAGRYSKMLLAGGVIVALFMLAIILIITLSVVGTKPCDHGKGVKEVPLPCKDGWILYLGICYFFSETDGSWTNSQHFCASHNASLAVIATPKEMPLQIREKGK